MNFTRGIIILTVLLLSVTVSFFMGRILGNELMAGGKETLEAFTTPGDGEEGSEATLAGTPNQPAYSYEGPTANKFPSTWGTIEETEGDAEVVSIEAVGSSGGESESGMSDLFSLDEGAPEVNQQQFTVQIGVFEHKENSDNLVADLKKEAYPAYTSKVVYEGGETLWKVYVGPFKTLEAAQAAAEELRVRNYDCYVQ